MQKELVKTPINKLLAKRWNRGDGTARPIATDSSVVVVLSRKELSRESRALLICLVCCWCGVVFSGAKVVLLDAHALSGYGAHDVAACVDGFQYGWFVVFHDVILLCFGSISDSIG
jgi:hypothetical protein